jgi:peroxiredoxin
MNKLKAYYMMALPLLLMGVIGTSLYHLFSQMKFQWHWLFTLMTALPLLMFLMVSMVRRARARTHPLLPLVTIITSMSFLGTFYFVLTKGTNTTNAKMALILATTALASQLLYIFWYSWLDRPETKQLKVGKPLPQFEIKDEQGRLNTTSFLGSPTIFIFYRGNWCPFCVAQIKELAQQYRQLALAGVKVVLISPQPEEITKKLAERFDVPFIFVRDANNKLARQLGLLHKDGVPKGLELFGYDSDTVYPTVVVTDTTGTVLFLDETDNYRNRPDPKKYLRLLARITNIKPRPGQSGTNHPGHKVAG